MRTEGDPHADAVYAQILENTEGQELNQLFRTLANNQEVPPATTFAPFNQYFDETHDVPQDPVVLARLQRGQDAFMRRGQVGVIILLTKGLPTGYCMPCLTQVLMMSEALKKRPFHRLLGVAQLLLNVCSPGSFKPKGAAVITAQKVRLLHAGLRRIADQVIPDYRPRYGVAVNQEDLLATLMGFSLLVIQGFRQLGAGLSAQEEEDYLYLWNQYGLVMGIKPEYLPENVEDAEAFFEAYERRHAAPPEQNPDGVELARAHLDMFTRLMGAWGHLLGNDIVPLMYLNHLMGPERCERLTYPMVEGHEVLKLLLHRLPPNPLRHLIVLGKVDRIAHERLAEDIVQKLISDNYSGRPSFWMPMDLDSLRSLVNAAAVLAKA
ncbi:oxygenase MpaB family protein [Melittangium boletus]|uniref:oxygenase MpaB family protein n=1 Tax=Melittangium boletus TaxID=83453 RepID=UPI003DA1EE1F